MTTRSGRKYASAKRDAAEAKGDDLARAPSGRASLDDILDEPPRPSKRRRNAMECSNGEWLSVMVTSCENGSLFRCVLGSPKCLTRLRRCLFPNVNADQKMSRRSSPKCPLCEGEHHRLLTPMHAHCNGACFPIVESLFICIFVKSFTNKN